MPVAWPHLRATYLGGSLAICSGFRHYALGDLFDIALFRIDAHVR